MSSPGHVATVASAVRRSDARRLTTGHPQEVFTLRPRVRKGRVASFDLTGCRIRSASFEWPVMAGFGRLWVAQRFQRCDQRAFYDLRALAPEASGALTKNLVRRRSRRITQRNQLPRRIFRGRKRSLRVGINNSQHLPAALPTDRQTLTLHRNHAVLLVEDRHPSLPHRPV